MRTTLFLLILSFNLSLAGQDYEYVYRNPADSSYNCYLKLYPRTDSIRGLIIRDFSRLFDASEKSPYQFTELSRDAGMMILITNTSSQFPELFTHDYTIKILDDMVLEVIRQHQIPEHNIFIGGISASGTRAMRYAQYCAAGKSTIKIRGLFAVDSPLDLARFYHSAAQHQQNFTDGMLDEAKLMLPLFDSLFGGSPQEHPEAYLRSSVFSHSDSVGGNAALLKNTDMILFHEPDIDWWIKERGCSYYDINSYDLAAFTVLQKNLGNTGVTLVTTSGKGFDRQGPRKPHSWTIVDEDYLLQWILERTE